MQGNSYKNRKQDENVFVYGRTTSNSTNQKCANAKLPLKTYAIVVRNRQKTQTVSHQKLPQTCNLLVSAWTQNRKLPIIFRPIRVLQNYF